MKLKKFIALTLSASLIAMYTGCMRNDSFESLLNRSSAETEQTFNIDTSNISTSSTNSLQNNYDAQNFYRDMLDSDEQEIYDNIYENLKKCSKKINLGNIKENKLKKIYDSVFLDHPELFYITGGYSISYFSIGFYNRVNLVPEYRVDVSKASSMLAELNSKIDEISLSAQNYTDDYSKALFVHDYIINNCKYDKQTADYNSDINSLSYTAYSCLINGTAVCAGYTAAFEAIMHRLGIVCGVVYGTSKESGEEHNWNFLILDGNYYYTDVTWDDPIVEDRDTDICAHKYCFVKSEDIEKDHNFNGDNLYAPECTADADNYFKKSGCYITDFNLVAIGEILNSHSNEKNIEMKFANYDLYDYAFKVLIQDGKIYNFNSIPKGTVSYMKDDDFYILTICLP